MTYWGYNNMEEVEGNMTAFRDGAYPIDSFIMDCELIHAGSGSFFKFHPIQGRRP